MAVAAEALDSLLEGVGSPELPNPKAPCYTLTRLPSESEGRFPGDLQPTPMSNSPMTKAQE